MTKPLSPEARAVFEAFNSKFEWIEDGVPGPQFKAIAAAIRAVADQLVPEEPEPKWYEPVRPRQRRQRFRRQLLFIAAELEVAS